MVPSVLIVVFVENCIPPVACPQLRPDQAATHSGSPIKGNAKARISWFMVSSSDSSSDGCSERRWEPAALQLMSTHSRIPAHDTMNSSYSLVGQGEVRLGLMEVTVRCGRRDTIRP